MVSDHEIVSIASYLIGEVPSEQDIERYARLRSSSICDITDPLDLALWHICIRFPILFGPVDSVLAIFSAQSHFRKRLFYALSIFEMEAVHYSKFLKSGTRWIEMIQLGLELFSYPLQLVLGLAVVLPVTGYVRAKCLIT